MRKSLLSGPQRRGEFLVPTDSSDPDSSDDEHGFAVAGPGSRVEQELVSPVGSADDFDFRSSHFMSPSFAAAAGFGSPDSAAQLGVMSPTSAAAAGFGSPATAGFGSLTAAGFGSPTATDSPNKCPHGLRRKDACHECWQSKQVSGPTAYGIYCKHGENKHLNKKKGKLCGDPECDDIRDYTLREFVTHRESVQQHPFTQGVIGDSAKMFYSPIPNSAGLSSPFTGSVVKPVRRVKLFDDPRVFESSSDEMIGGRKKYRKSKRKVRKSSRKSKRKGRKSSRKSKKLTKM